MGSFLTIESYTSQTLAIFTEGTHSVLEFFKLSQPTQVDFQGYILFILEGGDFVTKKTCSTQSAKVLE